MKPRARLAGLAVGLCAVAASLTGCLSVTANVSVNPDATASGQISLELAKQAASMLGIMTGDDFVKQITEGELNGGENVFSSGQCEPQEKDESLAVTCSFDNQTFTDSTGPWTISRQGEVITMHIMNGQQATEGADSSTDLGLPLGRYELMVDLPGEVQSLTGAYASQVDGDTVRVDAPMNDEVDVTITSAVGGGLMGQLPILVAAAALLAGIIVVILVVARRRKPQAPMDPATLEGSGTIQDPPNVST